MIRVLVKVIRTKLGLLCRHQRKQRSSAAAISITGFLLEKKPTHIYEAYSAVSLRGLIRSELAPKISRIPK